MCTSQVGLGNVRGCAGQASLVIGPASSPPDQDPLDLEPLLHQENERQREGRAKRVKIKTIKRGAPFDYSLFSPNHIGIECQF